MALFTSLSGIRLVDAVAVGIAGGGSFSNSSSEGFVI